MTKCNVNGINEIDFTFPGASAVTVNAGVAALTVSEPSGTANEVMATPNGSSGVASLRAIVIDDLPSGIGTVTAVSVVTANGFEGSSSGGPTPALTLNVDASHVLPINTGASTSYLDESGHYSVPTGSGGGGTTTDALTAAATGGAAPGTTFNGSAAVTIDYHTVGADVAGAAAAVTLSGLGGVPTSTTVNGHALSSNVVVSASDLTTGTLPHAQLPTLISGDIPANAANTSGTASNLSGTPTLPSGTKAATQTTGDNTADLATDAFVNASITALSLGTASTKATSYFQTALTNPVTGPGSGATVGHLAIINATSGDVIADGGVVPTSFPGFGTTSGTAAQGGVIAAGGPTGSPSVVPVITYNAAGQLTAVTTATITPAAIGADVSGAAAAVTPTTLGLVIGTNTEAHSANLDSWSAIATSTKQATLTNPVTGPGSGATVGHLAVMGNTSGTSITDGGAVPVGTVTLSGSPVSPNIAAFSSSSAITAATSANIQTAIGASVYDTSGAAATAQSNAETFAANASNISSGTVGIVYLPTGTSSSTVVKGGTITAAGPIGSTTAIPILTYNAAGQLTAVTTATPAVSAVAGKSLTGSGASIPTGPTSSTNGDLVSFTGAAGQIADSGIVASNVPLLNAVNAFTNTGTSSFAGNLQLNSSTTSELFITSSGAGSYSVVDFKNTGASGYEYQFGLGGNLSSFPNSFYIYDSIASAARFLINSSGNIGVGSTSPSNKLDVIGGMNIGCTPGSVAPSNGLIVGGNVGIGTITPTSTLEVYAANSGGLGATLTLNNIGNAVADATAIIFNDSGIGGSSSVRAAISSTVEGNPYYGNLQFKTGASVYGSLNTRVTIQGSTGNVGIGTTTPHSPLAVVGLPLYSTNALAIAGGLAVGDFYRVAGAVSVVY